MTSHQQWCEMRRLQLAARASSERDIYNVDGAGCGHRNRKRPCGAQIAERPQATIFGTPCKMPRDFVWENSAQGRMRKPHAQPRALEPPLVPPWPKCSPRTATRVTATDSAKRRCRCSASTGRQRGCRQRQRAAVRQLVPRATSPRAPPLAASHATPARTARARGAARRRGTPPRCTTRARRCG
jgi:hypothetical protein